MKTLPILISFLAAILCLPAAAAYAPPVSGSMPPTQGSILKINVIDNTSGSFAPANLTVRIDYTDNGAAKSSVATVPITTPNQEVNLEMPPQEYNPTAHITAGAFGYYGSPDEIVITSGQYWNSIPSGADVPKRDTSGITAQQPGADNIQPPVEPKAPYLAQHTFTLARKPGFTPNSTVSGGGCLGTEFILLFVSASVFGFSLRRE